MRKMVRARRIRWQINLLGLILLSGFAPNSLLAEPTTTPTRTPTQTPTQTPTLTPLPESLHNYEGDRVIFSWNVPVTVKDGINPDRESHLLAGTQLLGLGKPRGGKYSFVVTKCSPIFGILGRPPVEAEATECMSTPYFTGCRHCPALVVKDDKAPSGDKIEVIPLGAIVEVAESDVTGDKKPSRYGFAFGTLVSPFKFQLTHDHDLTGSATLGGYLGYRLQNQFYGLAVTPAVFGGATNLPVPSKDGKGTNQVMGFSYGGALLLDVKSSFQAGVILGWDRTADSENYEYNNKPWIGFQIGYSFVKTDE